MDNADFKKYIDEMKAMSRLAVPTVTEPQNVTETPPPDVAPDMSGTGFLLVNVTSVRGLYPVENARVTIFKGDIMSAENLATSLTDESGKTELFSLAAPPIYLAQDSDNKIPPFSTYNILTEADGFLPTINYNAAVFDKVTSIQNVNLIPRTSMNDGENDIFYENNDYEL